MDKMINKIINYLKNNLSEDRYKHVLNVRDETKKLCMHYHCDFKKAEIAALLHDAAKELGKEKILNLIKSKSIEIDSISLRSPGLLHGLAGAIIAKDKFNIVDEDILNAITYHTTGREAMSLLEKIIYLADYVEISRTFKGVQKLRDTVYGDLDSGMLEALNITINHLIKKNKLIHLNTIKARNYYLLGGE